MDLDSQIEESLFPSEMEFIERRREELEQEIIFDKIRRNGNQNLNIGQKINQISDNSNHNSIQSPLTNTGSQIMDNFTDSGSYQVQESLRGPIIQNQGASLYPSGSSYSRMGEEKFHRDNLSQKNNLSILSPIHKSYQKDISTPFQNLTSTPMNENPKDLLATDTLNYWKERALSAEKKLLEKEREIDSLRQTQGKLLQKSLSMLKAYEQFVEERNEKQSMNVVETPYPAKRLFHPSSTKTPLHDSSNIFHTGVNYQSDSENLQENQSLNDFDMNSTNELLKEDIHPQNRRSSMDALEKAQQRLEESSRLAFEVRKSWNSANNFEESTYSSNAENSFRNQKLISSPLTKPEGSVNVFKNNFNDTSQSNFLTPQKQGNSIDKLLESRRVSLEKILSPSNSTLETRSFSSTRLKSPFQIPNSSQSNIRSPTQGIPFNSETTKVSNKLSSINTKSMVDSSPTNAIHKMNQYAQENLSNESSNLYQSLNPNIQKHLQSIRQDPSLQGKPDPLFQNTILLNTPPPTRSQSTSSIPVDSKFEEYKSRITIPSEKREYKQPSNMVDSNPETTQTHFHSNFQDTTTKPSQTSLKSTPSPSFQHTSIGFDQNSPHSRYDTQKQVHPMPSTISKPLHASYNQTNQSIPPSQSNQLLSTTQGDWQDQTTNQSSGQVSNITTNTFVPPKKIHLQPKLLTDFINS